MIHPDNNIAVVVVRRSDGDRFALRSDSNQRTGGVEADAGYRERLGAGGGKDFPHAFADRLQICSPDCSTICLGSRPMIIGRLADARSLPATSKRPAQTLPVPTSIPTKKGS